MGTVNSTYHKAYILYVHENSMSPIINHLGTSIITANYEMNVDNSFSDASVPAIASVSLLFSNSDCSCHRCGSGVSFECPLLMQVHGSNP